VQHAEIGPLEHALEVRPLHVRLQALELLTSRGFTNVLGDKLVNTGSTKGIMLKSPSGFIVNLVKHIKK
jgi:hypothetical protein